MSVGWTGGECLATTASPLFHDLQFHSRSCNTKQLVNPDAVRKKRRCLPVIEVNCMRLANDGANEGSESNSSGGDRELHDRCK